MKYTNSEAVLGVSLLIGGAILAVYLARDLRVSESVTRRKQEYLNSRLLRQKRDSDRLSKQDIQDIIFSELELSSKNRPAPYRRIASKIEKKIRGEVGFDDFRLDEYKLRRLHKNLASR